MSYILFIVELNSNSSYFENTYTSITFSYYYDFWSNNYQLHEVILLEEICTLPTIYSKKIISRNGKDNLLRLFQEMIVDV